MIIVAILLAAAAIGLVVYAINALKDVSYSNKEYVTNSYDITDGFQNISIKADTEDVIILPSDDGTCKAICREEEDDPHRVSVEGDTLTIEKKESKAVQIDLTVNTEGPSVTLYLTEPAYQALAIETDSGSVSVSDLAFSGISIEGDSGDVDLISVTASGSFQIETESGDIAMNSSDAGEIYATTDSGDITGSLLSGKNFSAQSDSGDVEIPEDSTGGVCELTTGSGDIVIR